MKIFIFVSTVNAKLSLPLFTKIEVRGGQNLQTFQLEESSGDYLGCGG